MQIYLSHASADKLIAYRIRDELLCNDIFIWLNEIEDNAEQVSPKETRPMLQESDVLSVVFSSSSASSKWIKQELYELQSFSDEHSRIFMPSLVNPTPNSILIKDYRCADFSQRFEIGVSGLLAATRMTEQIESEEDIESLYKKITSILSEDELRFYLEWEFGEIIYVSFNREEDRVIPPPIVEKLSHLGLANMYGTCQEDVWYDVSPMGKVLQEFILKK